ncbi:MAG: hypothetical protein UX17_C0026G0004 [Parcubacteria group bacterium GW2011_GWC2_45_7]|nr:MAG: hypothetical protein UX17_C0026G0004 [Parcubacteria group bacterium GW2011_GWC2_45_7]
MLLSLFLGRKSFTYSLRAPMFAFHGLQVIGFQELCALVDAIYAFPKPVFHSNHAGLVHDFALNKLAAVVAEGIDHLAVLGNIGTTSEAETVAVFHAAYYGLWRSPGVYQKQQNYNRCNENHICYAVVHRYCCAI